MANIAEDISQFDNLNAQERVVAAREFKKRADSLQASADEFQSRVTKARREAEIAKRVSDGIEAKLKDARPKEPNNG